MKNGNQLKNYEGIYIDTLKLIDRPKNIIK